MIGRGVVDMEEEGLEEVLDEGLEAVDQISFYMPDHFLIFQIANILWRESSSALSDPSPPNQARLFSVDTSLALLSAFLFQTHWGLMPKLVYSSELYAEAWEEPWVESK